MAFTSVLFNTAFSGDPWQTHCTWRGGRETGGRPGSLGRGAGEEELTPCRGCGALLGHHASIQSKGLWYWPGGEFICASSPVHWGGHQGGTEASSRQRQSGREVVCARGGEEQILGCEMKRALVSVSRVFVVCP